MTDAIHDRSGEIVGWFDDPTIFDLSNRPRGYVLDGGVFDYHGRYRGSFENGVFHDLAQLPVALVAGASGEIRSALDWEAFFGGEDAPDEGGVSSES